jgi:hypothetical protein
VNRDGGTTRRISNARATLPSRDTTQELADHGLAAPRVSQQRHVVLGYVENSCGLPGIATLVVAEIALAARRARRERHRWSRRLERLE